MCPIKLRTKCLFRIFQILKINRIMLFFYLFMERPLYFALVLFYYIVCICTSDEVEHLTRGRAEFSYSIYCRCYSNRLSVTELSP